MLELYCGVGTLSLPLGKLGLRLRGVENHAAAVEDARANAVLNSIQGVSFTVAEALRAFDGLPPDFKPQVLLMDPPRKGMDRGASSRLRPVKSTRCRKSSTFPATRLAWPAT